jgi:hypothetical protein
VVFIDFRPERSGPNAISLPADARGYAAGLYGALREADARMPSLIVIVRPPGGGADSEIWRAVHDRIKRAAAAHRP